MHPLDLPTFRLIALNKKSRTRCGRGFLPAGTMHEKSIGEMFYPAISALVVFYDPGSWLDRLIRMLDRSADSQISLDH